MKQGYIDFIEDNFMIINKEGKTVPIRLNSVQRAYCNKASDKDYILKARQQGFTSLILAIYTVDFLVKENSQSVVVADSTENAIGLLDRVKFYIKSYEEKNGVKVPLKYNSKYELFNEATNSKYSIGTAENSEFGRSKTLNNLHFSEANFYRNFRRLLASAMQAVVPGGRVTIESTANGFNEAREFWEDSKKGLTGFQALFFPASHFYSVEFLKQKLMELGRYFKQEYPETDEEAFLTSGDCYFDVHVLKKYLDGCQEPITLQL